MSGRAADGASSSAIDRWVDALNAPTDSTLTEAAFTDDGVVERCSVHETRGEIVDVFTGHAAIVTWVARVPDGTVFTRTSEVTDDPADASVATARYQITVEDFVGGGLWRFRVGADGRLTWLHHQPDDLPSYTANPAE